MTFRPKTPLLAAVAASAALLSACSSSTADTEAQALQTVEPGKFTCGMSGEYRPFNFYGEDTELQGFDVDMCKEIAERLDLDPAPKTGQFNTLVAGLSAGRYDAVVGSMANTPERAKEVDFSEPYYSTGTELFVGPDSAVEEIGELKDATVGVTLGTTFEEFARTQENITDVKTYKSDIEALKDLEAGRLDGVITQGLMGRFLTKNTDLKVKAVGGVLQPDVASIPVKKGNTALLAKINQALDDINNDGTFSELSVKWFGQDISQDSQAPGAEPSATS